MQSRFVVVVLVVALAILTVPAFAQSSDVGVWYSGSKTGTTNTGSSSIEFKNGNGYGISFNHFFGSHVSAEATYVQQRADGQLNYLGSPLFDTGKLTTKTITAIAQWHLGRTAFFDPYLGAGAAYTKADDLSSADLTGAGMGVVSIDSKWGWAANAGVNLNLLHNFAFAVDGKYIPYEPESGVTKTKLKLNPFVYSAGVRFRF